MKLGMTAEAQRPSVCVPADVFPSSYLLELGVKPISKAVIQRAAEIECGDGNANL